MFDKQIKNNRQLNKTHYKHLVACRLNPRNLSLGHDQESVLKVPQSQITTLLIAQPEVDHLSPGFDQQINHSSHRRGSHEHTLLKGE